MITNTSAIVALFILPLLGTGLYLFKIKDSILLRIAPVVTGLQVIVCINMVVAVSRFGNQFAFGKLFFSDMLSAFELSLVSIIFFISSIYLVGYFEKEHAGTDNHYRMKRFAALWFLFLLTMTIVFSTNSMGILWVALEATTLASAFLIMTKGQTASIEAMWKYLLVCSVGIAFGMVGTLLLSVAAQQLPNGVETTLLWTELRANSGTLDKLIMLAAFVFALVGFGTKAGLAPMHTWLPDAHSQAPSPVSAVFSAVMLNSALYAILRYLPLTEGALGGNGQARMLLVFFGMLSIGTSMVFIPSQRDIKRFLAYSSIEHIGIIATGAGLGGLGVVAALLHTFNHSFAKMTAFFSAGKIVQTFETRDMDKIHGAIATNRTWGIALFVSVLALIGAAPFAIFISEMQIIKAMFDKGNYVTLALLLFGIVVIFIAALKHLLKISLGTAVEEKNVKNTFIDKIVVSLCLAVILALGLWIPSWFWTILDTAANCIGK